MSITGVPMIGILVGIAVGVTVAIYIIFVDL